MKRIKKLFFAAILIGSALQVFCQQNLVATNPGFELGDGTAWSFLSEDGSVATFNVTDQNPQEGTYCVTAELDTLGTHAWSTQLRKTDWGIIEGGIYEISIWAKSATSGSKVNFTVGKNTSPYTEYVTHYDISLTQSWKKYTLLLESTVTTTDDIAMAFHLTNLDTYWVDNFKVIEITSDVTSATIPVAGTSITVEFNNDLIDPSNEIQVPFFVRNENNEEKGVTGVRQSSTPNILILTLNEPVYQSEVITLEYIPGTLSTVLGNEIAAFTMEVDNNSTVTAPSSIDKTIANKIRVYPNPAKDFITLQSSLSIENYSYKIIDLAGKELKSGVFTSNSATFIDVKRLEQGLYILTIYDNKNNSLNYKFIKN